MKFNFTKYSLKSHLKNAAVILLSIILLGYTVFNSGLKWEDLMLTKVQYIYIGLAILVFLFTIYVQSLRTKIVWKQQLKNYKKIDTFSGIALGNFYNCILPGNLGEGIRIWHFSKKNKLSVINSIASIGVEKYIDAYAFVGYILIMYLYQPDFFDSNMSYLMLVAIGVLSIIVFYLLYINIRKLEKFSAFFLFKLNRTGRWIYKLHYTIKYFINKIKKIDLILYLTVGLFMFLLNILQYYLIMKATGINEPILSVFSAMIIATCMVIIYLIPSAPGNIGVMHFGIYSLLLAIAKTYGVIPEETDLQIFGRFTVYLHLSYFLPEVTLGLLILIKEYKWLV